MAADPSTASIPPAGTSLEGGVREVVAGDVFEGTYRIVKKLGEGGMGTVFLARDQRLDRDVAVKVLARHLCEDSVALARFVYEARMTARFDHANIVAVYGVGQFHDRPFIVMKLLDGMSLAQRLKQRPGPWPWLEARAILEPLCRGLTYLHEQGFVHRDVKPSNVNLSPSGHVTLLDFGVLKELSKERTGTGQLLGTLRYMAPEQLTDTRKVDARADVYALGVMAYLLLTGQHPYEGDDFSVARRKVEEDARDARKLNHEVGERVAAVLVRAVSREPARRFDSAAAFLQALDEAQAAPKRARRGVWVAAGVASFVVVVGGTAAALLQPQKPVPTTPPEPVAVVEPAPAPAPVVAEPAPEPAKEPEPAAAKSKQPARARAPALTKVSVVTMVSGSPSYAELKVDGVSRGETPAQLELPAGSHRIKLTREGFKTYETTLKVVAGKPDRVVVELRPAP